MWASQLQSFSNVDGNEQSANLLSQFQSDYGADLVGSTIARTFITFRSIVVTPPQAGGLAIGTIVAPGTIDNGDLGPVSAEARHLDWSFSRVFFYQFDPMNGIMAGEIDNRGMRKMEEIAEFYALSVQATGGDVFNLQVHARTLLLLP